MRERLANSRLGAMLKAGPVVVGLLAALGAALAYGSGQVVARKVVTDRASPLVASLFGLLFGSLVLGALIVRDIPGDMKAPRRAWVHIGLAGLSSSVAVTLFYMALSREPVVVVSPVGSLTPLFALLFTHLFLQRLERVTLRIVAGTVLVVVGIVLVIVGST